MRKGRRWLTVASIGVGLFVSACKQEAETLSRIEPARIAEAGETLYRVRLTARKAEEYNIETASVREEQVSGRLRKLIPSGAVVSDHECTTWTFTNPESLVFVRHRIHVDYIKGDSAVLSDGPPAGTAVVMVGAAKLFMSEFREKGETPEKKRMAEGPEGKKPRGMATMQEDGKIRLVYRTAGVTGLTADIVIEYTPKDEAYQKILDQVGGLEVGESKPLPLLADESGI
jgi:hypothetical protein